MNETPPTPLPKSTKVWGRLEKRRFLKLPKTFAFLGRYDDRVGKQVHPRHLMLIIALACRKFQDEPIRATWDDIASGLGVRADTLRRWAYELRDLDLLTITRHRDPFGGNGPNEFDVSPFVALLEDADEVWQQRQEARTHRDDEVPPPIDDGIPF
ncbi:MAG: hypothetical protein PVI86_11020 [Phycisphaerae bacterium]|jgi:hypothetical protein